MLFEKALVPLAVDLQLTMVKAHAFNCWLCWISHHEEVCVGLELLDLGVLVTALKLKFFVYLKTLDRSFIQASHASPSPVFMRVWGPSCIPR